MIAGRWSSRTTSGRTTPSRPWPRDPHRLCRRRPSSSCPSCRCRRGICSPGWSSRSGMDCGTKIVIDMNITVCVYILNYFNYLQWQCGKEINIIIQELDRLLWDRWWVFLEFSHDTWYLSQLTWVKQLLPSSRPSPQFQSHCRRHPITPHQLWTPSSWSAQSGCSINALERNGHILLLVSYLKVCIMHDMLNFFSWVLFILYTVQQKHCPISLKEKSLVFSVVKFYETITLSLVSIHLSLSVYRSCFPLSIWIYKISVEGRWPLCTVHSRKNVATT